jgi:pimeloyl-ACP methyl ester carboxylesterase
VETESVVSADGTVIGYRRWGTGPGVVLLSGGYLAGQHYTELAGALAADLPVYLPDRRGRGASGPPGERYGLARECEDVAALLAATGSRWLFGHSSGGLIALRAARVLDGVEKVAVYEPALSMYGIWGFDWVPRFEAEMDQGDPVAAIVTFHQGIGSSRALRLAPRWLLEPVLRRYLRRDRARTAPGAQPLAELLPLQRLDVQIFQEMAGEAEFADVPAEVLLLEGRRSPRTIRRATEAFRRERPDARVVTFARAAHAGPLNGGGSPDLVAAEVRRFLLSSHAGPRLPG